MRLRTLLHSLLVSMLAQPGATLSSRAQHSLLAADSALWRKALTALVPHKVEPLLAHQLAAQGLLDKVPADIAARLSRSRSDTHAFNMLLFVTTATILRDMQARGEQVLLLKGIKLADAYYPHFSTRPMSDIDLVSVPEHHQALFDTLTTLGFRPSETDAPSERNVTFVDSRGMICDAHARFPLFAEAPWQSLSEQTELTHMRGISALSLKPFAMLAHLAEHMHGHHREMGFVLLWLFDLGFVMRRHGAALEPEQVRSLCSERAFCLLLRALRLLAAHGEHVPDAWLSRSRGLLPLTLGAVLRQRRITPWGLPAPKGLLRLAAHQTTLKRYHRWPLPHPSDLLLWPLDHLCTYASPLLVRGR